MSDNSTSLITLSLASARLTRLIISDKITEKPRNALFKRFPPQSSSLGYLLTCPYCVSVWTSAVLTVLPSRVQTPVVTALAASFVVSEIADFLTPHSEHPLAIALTK